MSPELGDAVEAPLAADVSAPDEVLVPGSPFVEDPPELVVAEPVTEEDSLVADRDESTPPVEET